MTILVGYASAHQSTKGIAKAIGERLTEKGLEVDVRPVDEIYTVDAYDAVVLGSAIHNGVWLPEAADFLKTRAAALGARPVWLFSVSTIGETSSVFSPKMAAFARRMRKETQELAGFRKLIRPRDHRNFAGVIEPSHWGLAGDLFFKVFGGTYGDHRDWADIATWADDIAGQLRVETRSNSATTQSVHAD